MLGKGKRSKEWEDQRKKLKQIYLSRGITTCEMRLPGCWRDNGLSFAHRHKRRWYYDKPELLGSFNQTVLACIHCHNESEYDEELITKLFNKLRGEEK